MVDIMSLATQFNDWAGALVRDWGYLGIFIISFISSASIILPVPYFIFVFAAGAVLNPVLVAIAGGLGSALGEFSGYALGLGGKEAIKKKHEKWLKRTEKWVEKRGLFAIIMLFGATPLPDDVVGILAGALGYSPKKFFIACFIGKLILSLALAFGGFFGYGWILNMVGG